jgi:hypothetical protein
MVMTLETRILEHNMQQKAGIPAGNLVMATKTSSIKSHQTIIQQNEKQCHEEKQCHPAKRNLMTFHNG